MYIVIEEFEGLTYYGYITGTRPSSLHEAHSLEELLKQVQFNLERMNTMTIGRSLSSDTITIYFYKTFFSSIDTELALEMQIYFEDEADVNHAQVQITLLIDSMKSKELLVLVQR